MGFFGNFNSIGNIYSHLRKIEQLFNDIMTGFRAQTDKDYCNSLARTINSELREIKSIVESAGNTVKCADFQFMGSKKSIYQIIADTEYFVNMCKNRPNFR